MSGAVAKARLGYKNPALRWISSLGLAITGGVGSIVALVDLGTASIIEPVTKVVLSNPDHLRYTYGHPEYPFAAVVIDAGLAALSAAVGGVGLTRLFNDSDERVMAIAAPPVVAAFLSVLLGAGIGMGTASERVGGPQDLAWTKAYFSDSRVLPSYGMEQKEDGSYKYYANSVALTEKDGDKAYFMITPLVNDAGTVYGIDTEEVTQAKAKEIKANYDTEQSNDG